VKTIEFFPIKQQIIYGIEGLLSVDSAEARGQVSSPSLFAKRETTPPINT
jgi:hypothetical protein